MHVNACTATFLKAQHIPSLEVFPCWKWQQANSNKARQWSLAFFLAWEASAIANRYPKSEISSYWMHKHSLRLNGKWYHAKKKVSCLSDLLKDLFSNKHILHPFNLFFTVYYFQLLWNSACHFLSALFCFTSLLFQKVPIKPNTKIRELSTTSHESLHATPSTYLWKTKQKCHAARAWDGRTKAHCPKHCFGVLRLTADSYSLWPNIR